MTSQTTDTIIETIAQTFACLAAFIAPWMSPAAALLFTCKAKIKEIKPWGRQQNKTDKTVAIIAKTKLLLGAEAAALMGGGGFHG